MNANDRLQAHYKRGMEVLFRSAPVFAEFALSMGRPALNESIPTAVVEWNKYDKRITFGINPGFMEDYTDDHVAAVIAHETYHVLLMHLEELLKVDEYPDRQTLIQAQECIINDGLSDKVSVSLPDGFYSGPKMFGQDFSDFSTREGYDFIQSLKNDPETEESESPDQSNEGDGDSQSGGSGAGVSGGNDPGDDTPQDDSSDGDDAGGDNASDDDTGDEADGESGAGNAEENGDADDENSPDGSDGDSDSDEADEDAHDHSGGCGGVSIDPEDMDDFRDFMKSVVKDVIDKVDADDIPDSISDIIADNDLGGKGWGMGSNRGSMFASPSSNLPMNWVELLARINPKVKDMGRPKVKDTWQRPRRRLINSYPEIILPDRQRNLPDPKSKGDSIPTLIIALDLSYSIPRTLVNDLVGLLESVPEELISPRGITWADDYVVWDSEKRHIVQTVGTQIKTVYDYAQVVKEEIKRDPYVLVITDGDFKFPRFCNQEITKNWFWCGVQPGDERLLKSFQNQHYINRDNVYSLSDFR